MTVRKAVPKDTMEKLTRVGDIKPGSSFCFRFPGSSFEEVIAEGTGAYLYRVVKMTPEKPNRVRYISLDGLVESEAPADMVVIVHPVAYEIGEAERV